MTASLLAASDNQGIRLTVTVGAGVAWTVTRADGVTVRGGSGAGVAVFIDPAAPLNRPTTYLLATATESAQATATRVGHGHMLTSLNGSQQVQFRWLGDAPMPVGPRAYAATIPGRSRPVLRLQPTAGEDGISLTARTAGAQSVAMRQLLLQNEPMLLFHDPGQCQIPECDIPLVEAVFPSGSTVSNARTEHVLVATRDWGLDFYLIDMPSTGSQVGVGSWEQLEEQAMTWVGLEASALAWTSMEGGAWINE